MSPTNPLLLPKNAVPLFIPGPAGRLDCLRQDPITGAPAGVAIIFHPDPKGGGSYTNKIVQTLARALNAKGYICYCPNLRGVGESAGEHDYGRGEIDDAMAIQQYIGLLHPNLPLILAGFSFGCAVASAITRKLMYHKLILIAPAITRYSVDVEDTTKTIVIHGMDDEIISFASVLEWAKEHNQSIICLPHATHFFHGKLLNLTNILASFDL